MDRLLDFSQPLDILLLDKVVDTFYRGSGQDQKFAQNVLTQFQEHVDAWTKVDFILEHSKNPNSKFIGLQVLEKLIQTRWKILPREQCEGIRNYIVGLIIKMSSDDATLQRERLFVNKLNLILVQILKQEWPHNWPSFIDDIVGASKTNETLCENNMNILRLLSEEIFDFSAEQMVQEKVKTLKQQLVGEFSQIFQLCLLVLESATKPSLILATLGTLLRFLHWIPLGYIFETSLIEMLITKFFVVPAFRNASLQCLTEIGSVSVADQYDTQFIHLFNNAIDAISSMISINTDIAAVYDRSRDEEQKFIQNLALFFSGFLKEHLLLIEKHEAAASSMLSSSPTGSSSLSSSPSSASRLDLAHQYLLKISLVDEREVFKVCLEYWSRLVADLYAEMPFSGHLSLLRHDVTLLGESSSKPRKQLHVRILQKLRVVMVERMAKPEEVLVVQNDEGEVVREFMKDSDSITLYKSMRECLVYLTHLDAHDTQEMMLEKLRRQVDNSEWSWDNLNKLCWAIGSISGAMNQEEEKHFLVSVIKDLLVLCEMKRGKDNKAIVASNIMYIVGQYPRFLKAHWKFLKTVVLKLFEFMHETHEGVQDMACDTIIKIAQRCRQHFIDLQEGEDAPFIEEILNTLPDIISDLSPSQIHVFYEAVGTMIQAVRDKFTSDKYVLHLMSLPNAAWDTVMRDASQNVGILNNLETVKNLGNMLKTNVAACTSIGHGYLVQLARIYMDMLHLYKAVSQLISASIQSQGVIATKTPLIRGMRTIKKEILLLVETYVGQSADKANLTETFIPSLLDTVLDDYEKNAPTARDAEVLRLLTSLFDHLGQYLGQRVVTVLDAVFETTLSMINRDFEEFPEHRTGFFSFLKSLNAHCFNTLLGLPAAKFKLFVDSVVWAFKHTMRDIADIGLTIVLELLQNMNNANEGVRNGFYQIYFLSLLQDIFFVLTDTGHKSGFKLQAHILAVLINTVEAGLVTAPLGTTSTQYPSNAAFLQAHLIHLLMNAFPHLQKTTVQSFVEGLMRLNQDPHAFKAHLRDFLITIKEFALQDNSDLYLEEKEAELRIKQQVEREAALKIPGLLRPYERPDEMADM